MTVRYEKLIEEALKSVSEGPWTDEDLTTARDTAITADLCRQYEPDCTAGEIGSWLDSLDATEREELLFEMNADWNEGKEPWALG